MDSKKAFTIAMEASIQSETFKNCLVFGPRRSGTNYLDKLILLNTLNVRTINLDKSLPQVECRLVISNGFPIYGSKHDLSDKTHEKKFIDENINVIIMKSSIRDWLQSRISYQRSFAPSFPITVAACQALFLNEYVGFLRDLKSYPKSLYKFFFYESLNLKELREFLESKECLLTQFPVDLATAALPGGGISNKAYQKKILDYPAVGQFLDETFGDPLGPSFVELDQVYRMLT